MLFRHDNGAGRVWVRESNNVMGAWSDHMMVPIVQCVTMGRSGCSVKNMSMRVKTLLGLE